MPSAGEPESIVVVMRGSVGLGTVDVLARLQLVVRRMGGKIRLCAAPNELRELLVLVGLSGVFGDDDLRDGRRQTEEREKPVGVEEEADP